MTILLVLIVLALIFFGVGAIVEGLFWMLLIGFGLIIAALWFGWSKFRQAT